MLSEMLFMLDHHPEFAQSGEDNAHLDMVYDSIAAELEKQAASDFDEAALFDRLAEMDRGHAISDLVQDAGEIRARPTIFKIRQLLDRVQPPLQSLRYQYAAAMTSENMRAPLRTAQEWLDELSHTLPAPERPEFLEPASAEGRLATPLQPIAVPEEPSWSQAAAPLLSKMRVGFSRSVEVVTETATPLLAKVRSGLAAAAEEVHKGFDAAVEEVQRW